MTVFSDEQARQQLDAVLQEARVTGEVRIRTSTGQEYVVRPAPTGQSALDVGTVPTRVTKQDIVDAVREGRERSI